MESFKEYFSRREVRSAGKIMSNTDRFLFSIFNGLALKGLTQILNCKEYGFNKFKKILILRFFFLILRKKKQILELADIFPVDNYMFTRTRCE